MIWVVIAIIILFAVSFVLALAEASWRFKEERAVSTDAVAILRTLLLPIVLVLAVVWLGPVPGTFLTLSFFALQQVSGQRLGASSLANRAGELAAPILDRIQSSVLWLRIHKPEPTPELEQELIESVEDFSDTVVREVMIPRVDVTAVAADLTLEEALSVFVNSGHSRLPVFERNIDDIVGVLYLKDIARVTHQNPSRLGQELAGEIARRALFVPETKPVGDLLREMQHAATQIAIVADEYGGVAGIATVEDLIEEIVGDISDEYDRELPEIELIADGLFRVSPRMNVFELAEHFEVEIDDPEVDTVAGLLAKLLGHLPVAGDSATFAGIELTAERVDRKRQRLHSLLARRVDPDGHDD